jgi:hypothetical protein
MPAPWTAGGASKSGRGGTSLNSYESSGTPFKDWIDNVTDPLHATLADAADFLEQAGVAYALVGGLAASLRGQPRVTADVDLVIAADVDHALALAQSLGTTAFKPLFEPINDVIETAFILPLRHRTTGVKVDCALGLSGFEQRLLERAETLPLSGRPFPVAAAEELLVMKALAGRPQDIQDIQGILVAQGDRLDWEYCLGVAADLGAAVDQDLAGTLRELRRKCSEQQ